MGQHTRYDGESAAQKTLRWIAKGWTSQELCGNVWEPKNVPIYREGTGRPADFKRFFPRTMDLNLSYEHDVNQCTIQSKKIHKSVADVSIILFSFSGAERDENQILYSEDRTIPINV